MDTVPLLFLFAARLGSAVLHSLWQGALVAALLLVALTALRRRSAAARHAACLIALAVLLACFVATVVIAFPSASAPAGMKTHVLLQEPRVKAPSPAVAVVAEQPSVVGAADQAADQAASAPVVGAGGNENITQPISAAWRERLAPLIPWMGTAWMVGAAMMLLWRLAGWWRVRRLQRHGVAATGEVQRILAQLVERLGLRRSVRLLESSRALAPMLAGTLRPVILLPARALTGLDPQQLEAILAHELAHLVRGDTWSNLFQLLAETILFYHPAAWWIGSRARVEREHAADDLALRLCEGRIVYARALAQLAEMDTAAPEPALAATGGRLLARIRRIVGEPVKPEPAGANWVFAVAALLVFAALVPLHAQNAPANPDAAAPEAKSDSSQTPEAKTPEELSRKAREDAKPWVADAFQLDDKAKREAAIERVRQAMASSNVGEARTGIIAFTQLGPIEFDKASFRPLVRKLLSSSDVATRAAAAGAFTMTGTEPEDLPRIFALADDPAPEVRENLTYVIVQVTKYDLRDKAASDAILKLMAKLPRDSRSVAHALWGSKFSPEIEARVLEFTRGLDHASNGDIGYNFFYGALSTQANKSEASCKRLIELLAHQDTTNIAGRAAWGLQQGVDKAQFPLVADAMVRLIEARSDGYVRRNALNCLRSYGNAAQAPAVEAILAKPGVDGEFRKALEDTLKVLQSRVVADAPASSPSTPATAKAAPAVPAEKPEIEVEWKGKWWPAKVLKKEGERTQVHYIGFGNEWDEWVTAERIRPLNSTASAAGAQPSSAAAETPIQRDDQLVERNRQAARLRAADDRQNYTPEQLQEIETLYQVANTKGKRSAEAKASLKQLLEKYDKANRTGCATLYLGQASEGEERLEYLTRAVEKFSNCYYFNGCQVGGYGRYVLAMTLWEKGEKEKARALLAELKTTYKDATDHGGRPMGKVAEAVEKELALQQEKK